MAVTFRSPLPTEGKEVFKLVKSCPPLDLNSMYSYLLLCSHHANTCMVALEGEKIVGFVSGYLPPQSPETLFVWQVAVDESVRGRGLALEMISKLLGGQCCKDVQNIETTITEANKASWGLFESLANKLNSKLKRELAFDEDLHFGGSHVSEYLVTIPLI